MMQSVNLVLMHRPYLQVIEGQMDDAAKLDTAVAKSNVVLSLLGPNKMRLPEPSPYPGYYSTLFPLMRKHGVKRILAMSTLSVSDPLDGFSLLRWFLVLIVRLFAGSAYRTVHGIASVFQEEADGLDWTVYRIAMIPGGHDEESWKKDREDIPIHAGYVAKPGWQVYIRRGALARWLVDCAEGGATEWIGKLPAISKSNIAKERAE